MADVDIKAETKQGRLDRLYKQLRMFGEWDSDDMEWLLDEVNKDRALMKRLLRNARVDPEMGPVLRARLGVDGNENELRDQVRD